MFQREFIPTGLPNTVIAYCPVKLHQPALGSPAQTVSKTIGAKRTRDDMMKFVSGKVDTDRSWVLKLSTLCQLMRAIMFRVEDFNEGCVFNLISPWPI